MQNKNIAIFWRLPPNVTSHPCQAWSNSGSVSEKTKWNGDLALGHHSAHRIVRDNYIFSQQQPLSQVKSTTKNNNTFNLSKLSEYESFNTHIHFSIFLFLFWNDQLIMARVENNYLIGGYRIISQPYLLNISLT